MQPQIARLCVCSLQIRTLTTLSWGGKYGLKLTRSNRSQRHCGEQKVRPEHYKYYDYVYMHTKSQLLFIVKLSQEL